MRSARRRRPLLLRMGQRLLAVLFISSCVLSGLRLRVAADVMFLVFGVIAVVVGGLVTVNLAGSAEILGIWGRELRSGPLRIMSGPPDTTRGYRLLGLLFVALGLALIGLSSTDLVMRAR